MTNINKETVLNDDDFIVSKTNKSGIITYCNKRFIELSEYEEHELMGKNHNIIRHEDMPKVAYKIAWDSLLKGDEFFGFVKNKQKNGGFYWVFAIITPDFESNNIVGFTSVRRKVNENALEIIEPLYKKLLDAEKSSGINNSSKIMQNLLDEKSLQYNELIINLQGIR